MRGPARHRLRRLRAIGLWTVTLGLLGWLAVAQSRLEIDEHNHAMKAPGTHDAALLERLTATFGSQRTLVLAFLARTRDQLSARELEELVEVRTDLGYVPGVHRAAGPLHGPEEARITTPDDIAVLTVELEPLADAEHVVTAAAELCPATLRMLASGLPRAETAIARGVAAERAQLVPRIAAVLFTLLLLFYRDIGQALAVLLPSVGAILAAGGVMQLLGKQLDPVSVLLEPVLLTVGVATAVHVVGSFRRLRAAGLGPLRASLRTRTDLRWPLLLTTGTTLLGFWSLLANQIPAVADFGAYAALGTSLIHLANVVVLPIWLRAVPGRSTEGQRLAAAGVDPVAASFASWVVRRRNAILGATAILFVVAIASCAGLRVDNDPLAVLRPDDAFRRETQALSDHVGGVESFAILVDGDSEAQQPDRLLPFVASVAMRPPAVGLAGPVRRAGDGTVMLPVRLAPSGSRSRTELFDAIDRRAEGLGMHGVHTCGLSVQIARDSDRLVLGQLVGMLLALGGLGAGLWIGLRSLRMVLIGLAPNALPCVVLYGGLAWLDRPLTVANVMIGSVMLGLVVDNTIHLLHRYRHASGAPRRRLATAFSHTGRPLLTSSCVLAFGFGTGLGGSMATTIEISALTAATIGLALLSDALVLPALLSLTHGSRRP